MDYKPYAERIAELWIIQTGRSKRQLTLNELVEWRHCMDMLASDMYKQAELFNLSLVASMSNDVEWQHDICRKIDESKL